MYRFKIDNLEIKSIEGIKNITPKKINILVGPNNSGKSRLIKEIRDYLSGDMQDLKIINDISFQYPNSFLEIDEAYKVSSKMHRDKVGNYMMKVYTNKPSRDFDMSSTMESYFTRNLGLIGYDWKEHFSNIINRKDIKEFFTWLGPLFFQYVGTEERLTICKKQRNYGMDNSEENYLSSYKFKNNILENLRSKTIQLFNKDIYLDTQTLGNRLVFRVGENFDYVRNGMIDNQEKARRLYLESELDSQGDGLKSYVSTFLSLNMNENDILLLDEPEAFLHPPLARQLGEMIGETQRDTTIFVATHSVEILKGILSKTRDVNVIRITQPEPCKNVVQILNQEVLDKILKNSLLRVSRVLEGIFCDRVVITEAEADELVYQELIEKLYPESGLYFAHAQNKQTIHNIAQLYREINVEFEAIVDFDVFREPKDLKKLLEVVYTESKEIDRIVEYANKLSNEVKKIARLRGVNEKDIYHKYGIRVFDERTRILIRKTLNELSLHHIHILESGELETLLEEFDVKYNSTKSDWLIGAMDAIAELKCEDINKKGLVYRLIKGIVKSSGEVING